MSGNRLDKNCLVSEWLKDNVCRPREAGRKLILLSQTRRHFHTYLILYTLVDYFNRISHRHKFKKFREFLLTVNFLFLSLEGNSS